MKWGVVLGVLLLSPLYALAAGTSFFGPIVPPCTEYGGAVPICQACNAIQLVDNLLRFFISLAVMIAALMFSYAGYLYVSASSNKQNIDSAKKIFTNVFIGLILVLAAYLIIDLGLKVLSGNTLSLNVLSKIQCVKMETTTGSIKYTVVPGNNPVQGTQGGGASVVGNPVSACTDGMMTHERAMEFMNGAGIEVTSTAGPSGVKAGCSGKGCTTLTNICPVTVQGILDLGRESGCDLTVWGASEGGDAHGGTTHKAGCALDVSNTQCLKDWFSTHDPQSVGIRQICTTAGDSKYRLNCPNFDEGTEHFHLSFCGL
jgi:Type IV secretion system pilin